MNEAIRIPLGGQAVIKLEAISDLGIPLPEWPVAMSIGPVHYRVENPAVAGLNRTDDDGSHELTVFAVAEGETRLITEAQFAPPGRPPGSAAELPGACPTIQIVPPSFREFHWTVLRVEPKV